MLEKHPGIEYCKFVSEITNGYDSTATPEESQAVENWKNDCTNALI
jgi:hypothetical protein